MFFNKIITKERGKKIISVLGMVTNLKSHPTIADFFLSHQWLGMVKIGMISNAKVRNFGLAKAGYGNKIRGGKKKMSGNGGVNFEDDYTKNEAVP